MIRFNPSLLLAFLLIIGVGCRPAAQSQTTAAATDTTGYYQYKDGSRDGIGKFYQGREIAEVMGHLGADWLERPERQQEERTDLLASALQLKPTDVLADIGAGTGYFSFRLARDVPQGKVLAVDIQPEMIQYLSDNKKKNKAPNVEPILGTITDPKLPANGVDIALLVDAYHEFSNPREMLGAIVKSLKPGGAYRAGRVPRRRPECTHQGVAQTEHRAGHQRNAGGGPEISEERRTAPAAARHDFRAVVYTTRLDKSMFLPAS